MTRENEKTAPKCLGRFVELRRRAREIAGEIRGEKQDPLYALVTKADVVDFVQRMADQNGRSEEYDAQTVVELLSMYDRTDPFFNNGRDKLRGDPLIGDPENVYLAALPIVFEGMRCSLIETKKRSQELISKLRSVEEEDLEELALELFMLTGREDFEIDTLSSRKDTVTALKEILRRDHTVTATSVDPSLLSEAAALYVDKAEALDSLRLIHRGARSLDKELGIDMSQLSVPGKKNGNCTLTGYSIWAEYGLGLNTSGNSVASAPYRLELRKTPQGVYNIGDQEGSHVFAMAFYLKHPNTMVVYQIQDITGEKIPRCTTTGLCGLSIIEKVARAMEFDRVEAYSHHTHPVQHLYPDDDVLNLAMKMNFDEAARKLPQWQPETDRAGRHESYTLNIA